MTTFLQEPLPADGTPYIFEEGAVVEEYPVNWLRAEKTEGKPRLQVLLIAKIEGKNLCAVPQAVWNRKVAKRILPQPGLAKPTLVEVQSVHPLAMAVATEHYMKVWIGFLAEVFMPQLVLGPSDMECEFCFEQVAGDVMLPYSHGLVQVAQDHFAFFSAEEGDGQQDQELPGEEPGVEDRDQESGLGRDDSSRIDKLEQMMADLTSSVGQIAQKMQVQKRGPAEQSVPKEPLRPPALRPSAISSKRAAAPRVTFPSLDQGVVQAALRAGVSSDNLAEMERLISQNTKARKTSDLAAKVTLDPLSEDEDQVQDQSQAAEDGGSGDASPWRRP